MPTKHHSALEFIPENPTISTLWKAAQACTACDLYQKATQAVLGEGPAAASVFFLGEQPGDQEDLAGQPFADPAWWGGEFILGSVAGFAALKERLDWLWPRYLDRLGSLHHVGDEIVITAALAMMAADGETVVDAGRAGGVARWWSSRTLSALPPFRALRDRSLFHLPADKPFLSAQATKPFASDRFLENYEAMLRRKLAVRRVVSTVEKLLGKKSTKVAPRLA